MRIGCVIMASGEGRRFVRAGGAGLKLLARLAGEPLIVRTVRSVPEDRFETVVSTRWPAVERAVADAGLDAEVRLHDGASRSDSVRCGLDAGRRVWDGCLFLPGDQPLVSPASLRALADGFAAAPGRAWRLARSGSPASPVLFPRSCFDALMGLCGSDGGQSVLRRGAVGVSLVEAASDLELWDVDVPEDLARMEEVLACR